MTKQKQTRSGKKVKKSKILSEMYTCRDTINVFYFGGKIGEDGFIKKARFDSKKTKKELDKLWMPFYRNLFCRYTSNIDRKERWEINGDCVIEYENGRIEVVGRLVVNDLLIIDKNILEKLI